MFLFRFSISNLGNYGVFEARVYHYNCVSGPMVKIWGIWQILLAKYICQKRRNCMYILSVQHTNILVTQITSSHSISMFGRLATPRSDVIALPAVIGSAHSAEAGRRLTVSAIISHRIRQPTHISQKKRPKPRQLLGRSASTTFCEPDP